jgi:histidinol-phosphatase
MDGVAELQLAFDVSDLAAELALAHFGSGVSVTLKADGTPVTEADRAVERLLRETLSRARPDDAFLGEEFGRLGESDRVWLLDPIDGTGFFSRGDPNWRIHVALEVRGTTRVAVVTSPALRRCWWATRGGGSFESSWPREDSLTRRLRVSTTSTPADAVLDALDDESRARLPASAARAPASSSPPCTTRRVPDRAGPAQPWDPDAIAFGSQGFPRVCRSGDHRWVRRYQSQPPPPNATAATEAPSVHHTAR